MSSLTSPPDHPTPLKIAQAVRAPIAPRTLNGFKLYRDHLDAVIVNQATVRFAKIGHSGVAVSCARDPRDGQIVIRLAGRMLALAGLHDAEQARKQYGKAVRTLTCVNSPRVFPEPTYPVHDQHFLPLSVFAAVDAVAADPEWTTALGKVKAVVERNEALRRGVEAVEPVPVSVPVSAPVPESGAAPVVVARPEPVSDLRKAVLAKLAAERDGSDRIRDLETRLADAEAERDAVRADLTRLENEVLEAYTMSSPNQQVAALGVIASRLTS